MLNRTSLAAVFAALTIALASPAFATGEILLTHAKALAGNVTPGDPPGYPIILSLPGAYQLAGNIHPSAGSIGIQVTSPDVTIDLNGFRLHGSTTAFHGIAGGVDSVTIRNGTITGFKFDGIVTTGDNWRIERMRVYNNGRNGIVCDSFCLVDSAIVSGNSIGVQMTVGTVLGSIIGNNANLGISGTFVGFGNNTLIGNNGVGDEVSVGVAPMHPNNCVDCP